MSDTVKAAIKRALDRAFGDPEEAARLLKDDVLADDELFRALMLRLLRARADPAQPLDLADTDDHLRRACAEWFRSGGTDQPSNASAVEEHDGYTYVVLRNVSGIIMRVYRVRNDGRLKALRRVPAEIWLTCRNVNADA